MITMITTKNVAQTIAQQSPMHLFNESKFWICLKKQFLRVKGSHRVVYAISTPQKHVRLLTFAKKNPFHITPMFVKTPWPMLRCIFFFLQFQMPHGVYRKNLKRCQQHPHDFQWFPRCFPSEVPPMFRHRSATCPMRCCRTSLSAFALRDLGWRRPSGRTSTSVTQESPTTWEM